VRDAAHRTDGPQRATIFSKQYRHVGYAEIAQCFTSALATGREFGHALGDRPLDQCEFLRQQACWTGKVAAASPLNGGRKQSIKQVGTLENKIRHGTSRSYAEGASQHVHIKPPFEA